MKIFKQNFLRIIIEAIISGRNFITILRHCILHRNWRILVFSLHPISDMISYTLIPQQVGTSRESDKEYYYKISQDFFEDVSQIFQKL